MGLTTDSLEFYTRVPFTKEHVTDRKLIIKMLRFEDSIFKGEFGQAVYKNEYNNKLEPQFVIQRRVLTDHGFDTSDHSLENYRSIFKHYYRSPTDYDKEVINSVVYMRENRCIYYTEPIIDIGDRLPNCDLYELDGTTKTDIYTLAEGYNKCIVAAFSTS